MGRATKQEAAKKVKSTTRTATRRRRARRQECVLESFWQCELIRKSDTNSNGRNRVCGGKQMLNSRHPFITAPLQDVPSNFKQLIFATPLPKYFAFYRSGAGRRIFVNVGKCHPNRAPQNSNYASLVFSKRKCRRFKTPTCNLCLVRVFAQHFCPLCALLSDLSADVFYKFKVQTLPCYHSPGGIQPGLDQPSRLLSCSRARG